MMDFYTKNEYTIEDIKQLITNEVEENIHLDYKAAGSLSKEPKKKEEIAKDVSAFANSDGGIIVYGIEEKEHKASSISYIDGNIYTKEWLEQVVQDNIQRRIDDLIIFPIREDGDILKTIYIVKIPRSYNAPHMSADKCYYKRNNFRSVKMEEYEIRDLFNRISIPKLELVGCRLHKYEETENHVIYNLFAKIANVGHNVCELYKLNFYINRLCCGISYKPLEQKNSYTLINSRRLKLSSPSQEAIYPNEELDLGHFDIKVEKENLDSFFNKLVIDMILYYPGGNTRLAYIPYLQEYIEEENKIEALLDELEKEHNDIDTL